MSLPQRAGVASVQKAFHGLWVHGHGWHGERREICFLLIAAAVNQPAVKASAPRPPLPVLTAGRIHVLWTAFGSSFQGLYGIHHTEVVLPVGCSQPMPKCGTRRRSGRAFLARVGLPQVMFASRTSHSHVEYTFLIITQGYLY